MTNRELMQQALEAMRLLVNRPTEEALDYADNAITAIEDRLAHCELCGNKLVGADHIHTCSPQVQEPVMCRVCGDERGSWAWQCNHCGAFDESPQPRKPLTDEEIWRFWWARPEVPDDEDDGMEAEFVAAVRRVLAAHGIKGEA